MQKGLTFVLGGTKSGKSKFAEAQFRAEQHICYVATGVSQHPDAEMQLRIQRHQARRSQYWETAEQYRDLAQLVRNQKMDGYLIDDLTMLITNCFYELVLAQTEPEQLDQYLEHLTWDKLQSLTDQLLAEVQALLAAQCQTEQAMVIVSDEVGLGIVPATKQARLLRDLYGEANQLVAQAAEHVYLVVSGLPQQLK